MDASVSKHLYQKVNALYKTILWKLISLSSN